MKDETEEKLGILHVAHPTGQARKSAFDLGYERFNKLTITFAYSIIRYEDTLDTSKT